MAKLLGIDYGSSKVGLALADEETGIASPIEVIRSKDGQVQLARIQELIAAEGISKVVIGVPLAKGGKDTAQTQKTRQFADRLRAEGGGKFQVALEDERFSTRMSRQLLSQVKNGPEDAVAAAVILQGYLDRQAVKK